MAGDSPDPAGLTAEQRRQPRVVRREVLLKLPAAPGVHRRAGPGVGGGEPGLEGPQPEELQQPLVLPGGLAEVRGTVDHVYLRAGEELVDALKLLGVLATVPVGVMPVREAL